MAERRPSEHQSSSPAWVPIVVVGLAIFGAIAIVQFVLGALFGLVKLALVIIVAVAVIGAVVGRKGE